MTTQASETEVKARGAKRKRRATRTPARKGPPVRRNDDEDEDELPNWGFHIGDPGDEMPS